MVVSILAKKVDWQRVAKALAVEIPLKRWNSRALSFFKEKGDGKIAVACSGGVDSVSLLLGLWGHFPKKRGDLIALHFNHKLRGEISDTEGVFVKEICDALGIEFIGGEAQEIFLAKASEAELRSKRHAFYKEAMLGVGAKVLCLGHQADDVLETMVMRIVRGSSSHGLCAPRPAREFSDGRIYLRPYTDLPKRELYAAAGKVGLVWSEDASNQEGLYFRNRVRQKIIPLLEEATERDVIKGALRARLLLEEDDDALEAWAEKVIGEHLKNGKLELRELGTLPRAVLRRVLHRWLGGVGLVVTSGGFDGLLEKIQGGEGFKVSVGERIVIISDARVLEKKALDVDTGCNFGEIYLGERGIVFLPRGGVLEYMEVELDDVERDRIFSGEVNPGEMCYINNEKMGDFWVKQWESGDRYRALGASGKRKLQDLYTDRKIPRGIRRGLPVVCGRDSIAWSPGLPVGEDFKILTKTKRALRLTYRVNP